MASDPSKTEQATPKQVNKAREKGNVPRSAELGKTVTLTVGLIFLYLWVGYVGSEIQILMRHTFTRSFEFVATPNNVVTLFTSTSFLVAKLVLPVILTLGFLVAIVQRIQVGHLFTFKPLEPKLEKFNPIAGIKRMVFSLQTWGRMGKSLAQSIVIGIAPYMVIMDEWNNFVGLYYSDASTLAVYILQTSAKIVLYALIPMILIAIIDMFYTRWKYNEDLKMTKSEIKDEHKQSEGDPMMKQKQREKMMEVMKRRMMQDVPTADVIITNPTHIAIALKYNSMEAPAPVVVAKGADLMAMRIREIAREHNVPIRENKPLARALYKEIEVGEMIPEDLYQAVAAILASLNKFKKRPNPKVTPHGRGTSVK